MGEAKRRGTFEERKAEAVRNGRFTEARRKAQRQKTRDKQAKLLAIRKYLRELSEASTN